MSPIDSIISDDAGATARDIDAAVRFAEEIAPGLGKQIAGRSPDELASAHLP